ncbi:RecA-like DNA recombinase [Mycobacterium phage Muddy]|uniref:RecA-like DNA recombinase n=2 Tax=Mycobacterium phage Muddy TaxID=1340829 RepID=A0ACD4QAE7_9CAUD|nr:RecA-like DNA recombinase [Mycobacterium phage Muddy]WEV84098.1 RecA-like DNA recombinase [Mycobacterium phage Muddy]WKV22133.1 hypothetical protein 8UZL_00015 [Mycobacteroides phage 8UZL]
MDVDKQLRILRAIWRKADGYVFLPYIEKKWARTDERKHHWREGPAFRIPADYDKMRDHLEKHWEDDLYFSPMVFTGPKRISEWAAIGNRLWADLDEANPDDIKEELKPTLAWETSPGRFAAIWFMHSSRPETTERGGENHRLSIALGADPSGWDTTQLLRVPGSANNKPGYVEGIRGRLVWRGGSRLAWDEIDRLPEIPQADVVGGDLVTEQLLESIDPYESYARVKRKLRGVIRQYMRLKDDSGLDRSEIAWQVERELADAGCTLLEMVAIIRPTPWNKFEGRADELKRLTLECGKALALKKPKETAALDQDTEVKHKLVPFWRNEEYLNAPEPEWLYDQFIPKGGCGFISGIPKSMKTWLAMDLAISSALGKEYLSYECEQPINVLYVQREDPTTMVRSRHNVIASTKHPKYSLDRPQRELEQYPGALYVETMLAVDLSDEGWQTWLSDVIQESQLSLVIVDTLTRAAPGVDLDSASTVTGDLLNPMKEIARQENCALVFVHHNTKAQANGRAAQNMAGSGQIHAWADFGIYVTEKRENGPTIELDFTHETKYTGTNELTFRVAGLPDRWDPEEYVKSTPSKGRKYTDDDELTEDDLAGHKAPAAVRVQQYVRSCPDATTAEIAAACGVTERTVRRVRK